MTVTRRPSPRSIGSLKHVHHAGKGRITRKRKPIPHWLNYAVQLIFQVVRHSCQSVSLFNSIFIGNIFVASGKQTVWTRSSEPYHCSPQQISYAPDPVVIPRINDLELVTLDTNDANFDRL